jgi:hypothetical protein
MQGHTRINNITMAVSQCPRFTHNPKRSHELLALKQTGQYKKMHAKTRADITAFKR